MLPQNLLQAKSDFIWEIANLLRGPYRPPQYRRVMLPLTVLRRLDQVLEPSKTAINAEYQKLKAQDMDETTIEKLIERRFGLSFFNTSAFTFETLLNDPDNLAQNLSNYISSFSGKARDILERFKFEEEIDKLEDSNRLLQIMQAVNRVDLHPDRVPNLAMGYIFEDLIRRFNEQANEEAGDHFTPREVIRLIVSILFTGQESITASGKNIRIYDPTCGTGGMLSESEKYVREHNDQANIMLFGQEYNPESYAICGSDLMIKGQNIENIVFGDTLGIGRTKPGVMDGDGHPKEHFHYMLANPPFGVEWKPEQDNVTREHEALGFNGRFGAGLPRINDGALLFLLHMISKMEAPPEQGGDGARIGIIFNGSPLFTGDAGSGESNIRRWIIEQDMLETVIGLPEQLFYNTGIYTYIWIITNRKSDKRKGKVQLINATDFAWKTKKSLGNKRNKLGEGEDGEPDHIGELTQIYGNFLHDDKRTVAEVKTNVEPDKKSKRDPNKVLTVSKIFDNRDFGFIKLTVERPLRLNFAVTDERLERFKESTYFTNLATSKKRKDTEAIAAEKAAGEAVQREILRVLETLKPSYQAGEVTKNRDAFEKILKTAFKASTVKFDAALKKALLAKGSLGEQDSTADICTSSKGEPEADAELRDTENVALPEAIALPLPLDYSKNSDNSELVELVREHCQAYLEREVLPYRPDAWIDFSKTKVGYEIPFNRHFYEYEPPRPLEEIEADIKGLEQDILRMLAEVVA